MLSPTVVPRILRLVPLLVAVVLVAKTGPSVAEPGPGDPPAVPTKARERSQAQSYLYRAWTPANGLSQSSIRRLAESSDGYLWLASRAGLVRFDGLKFTAFGVAELPLLSTNESRVVAGAREGGVWVGAAGGVLFRTDGQRALEVLSPREGVIDDRRLAFARNGDLWTANGAGIDRLSGGRWTRFGGAAGIRDGAWTVDIDAAGTVWAGTSRGLFVLKGHSFEAAWTESQSRDFGTEVQSLLGDRRGNLWVGGGTGLSVRRPDGVFERPPGASSIGGPVIALSEGPDATVWGVTPRAVCAWRHEAAPDGPAWAATCYDVRLEGTSPTDLLVTREGVVVVATNTDGLRMLVPRPFRMITAADGLPETPVHHLAEDSDGALWVAAGCGGLSRVAGDGRVQVFLPPDLGLRQPCVQSLMRDRGGALWVGQQRGFLTRIAPDLSFRTWSVTDGLPVADIGPLVEDGRGGLWVGSSNGTVCRMEGDVFRCPATPALVAERIWSMALGPSGGIWVGQIGRVSEVTEGGVHVLTTQDDVPVGPIRVLRADRDGTLWVGSYGGGLARLRDGRVSRLTTAQGLFDNDLSAMLDDESGRTWLLGNRGVFVVARSELERALDEGGPGLEGTWFGADNGLPEGNGGHPVALLTQHGRALFGTVNGVAVFDRGVLSPAPSLSVVVESVFDQGEARVPQGEVRVQPGGGPVELRFAVPNLADPRKIRVRSQLLGRDPLWIDDGLERRVVYTDLSPGQYEFRPSVQRPDGAWTEPLVPLTLVVAPFWWQTWWARLFGFGFGVFAIVWLVRSRLAVAERRNEELRNEIVERQRAEEATQQHLIALAHMNRLATAGELTASLAHELGQPLTAIVANAEASRMMLAMPSPDAGEVGEVLGEIAQQGRRASEILGGLRAFLRRGGSHKAEIDLNAEIRDVIPLAWRELERAQVTLVVDLSRGPLSVRADRIPMQQVVLNLMTNASDAMAAVEPGHRRLTVRSRRVANKARVSVCDTGPGIDPDRVTKIFEPFYTTKTQGMGLGLSICKSIVEAHGGQIRARNLRDSGAAFSFWIPVSEEPFVLEDAAASHERVIS